MEGSTSVELDQHSNQNAIDTPKTVAQETLYRQQIDKLYDYTKFHIGIYTALIAAMVALQSFGNKYLEDLISKIVFLVTILFFLISAICGAIIASSIQDVYQNYHFWENTVTAEKFWRTKIGPYKKEWVLPSKLAKIEHTTFWIGILITILYTIFRVFFPVTSPTFFTI